MPAQDGLFTDPGIGEKPVGRFRVALILKSYNERRYVTLGFVTAVRLTFGSVVPSNVVPGGFWAGVGVRGWLA